MSTVHRLLTLLVRSTSANAHQKPASPATQFKEGYIEVTGPRLPEGLPVSQAAMAPVAGTVGLDTDLEGSVVDVPMDLSSAATSVLSSTVCQIGTNTMLTICICGAACLFNGCASGQMFKIAVIRI